MAVKCCAEGAEYLCREGRRPCMTAASVYAAGDDTSTIYVSFCPFCGARLKVEGDDVVADVPVKRAGPWQKWFTDNWVRVGDDGAVVANVIRTFGLDDADRSELQKSIADARLRELGYVLDE